MLGLLLCMTMMDPAQVRRPSFEQQAPPGLDAKKEADAEKMKEDGGLEGSLTEVAEGEEHPITKAVRKELESGRGGVDKPFELVVMITSDSGSDVMAGFRGAAEKTRAEEGNDGYDLSRNVADPNQFVLCEKWKSLEALDGHLKQDYVSDMLKTLEEKASVSLKVYRPVN